jgi:hypothetical protein
MRIDLKDESDVAYSQRQMHADGSRRERGRQTFDELEDERAQYALIDDNIGVYIITSFPTENSALTQPRVSALEPTPPPHAGLRCCTRAFLRPPSPLPHLRTLFRAPPTYARRAPPHPPHRACSLPST